MAGQSKQSKGSANGGGRSNSSKQQAMRSYRKGRTPAEGQANGPPRSGNYGPAKGVPLFGYYAHTGKLRNTCTKLDSKMDYHRTEGRRPTKSSVFDAVHVTITTRLTTKESTGRLIFALVKQARCPEDYSFTKMIGLESYVTVNTIKLTNHTIKIPFPPGHGDVSVLDCDDWKLVMGYDVVMSDGDRPIIESDDFMHVNIKYTISGPYGYAIQSL
nr:hypothetical protein [Monilinia fructicola beny-like virus 1]